MIKSVRDFAWGKIDERGMDFGLPSQYPATGGDKFESVLDTHLASISSR